MNNNNNNKIKNNTNNITDLYCEKLESVNWPHIDNCLMVTILGTILYSNYSIIIEGMKETLMYDFDYEKYIPKKINTKFKKTITSKNKKTGNKLKHKAYALGIYEIDKSIWNWNVPINETFRKQFNIFIGDNNSLIGTNDKVNDFYQSLFLPKIKINYRSYHIIPHLIQVIYPEYRLVKFINNNNLKTNKPESIFYILIDKLPNLELDMNSLYEEFEIFRKVTDTLDKLPKRLRKISRTKIDKQYINIKKLQTKIYSLVKNKYIGKINNINNDNGLKINIKNLNKNISREKVNNIIDITGKNKKIIKWFSLLLKQLEFYVDVKTGKDKLMYSYKVNSIKKALNIIANVEFKIKDGEQLREYKGIGDGTIARINEIIKTGKLSEVNDADISGKHLEYVEELMKIFGIGRVKAYELYTEHGIKSISDLKNAIKNKKLKLPENITKGIKYVDKIKTKIPREEIDKIYSYLIKIGIKYDANMDIRICGSYRREKEFSNDIDVIISHPDIITKAQAEKSTLMKNFIQKLIKNKFIVDSLTSLDVHTKYMGICQLNSKYKMRRIDIRFIPQESYYTALLYFTGSADFNTRMRSVALSMNYTLNEYRLLNEKGKAFKVKSEKDVFEYLNMEYMIPKDRI